MPFASDVDPYTAGTLIDDKYRLLRRVGEGGVSWVWLALHQVLDAPVAMKIAKPGCSGARTRSSEARIAFTLRHPAVVVVLDAGRTQWGDDFVVMEYLVGDSLARVLQRDGRLAAEAAILLLLPVLDALCVCHARGVVHRDIKPENLFLTEQHGRRRIKLLDFGTAKMLAAPCVVPEMTGTPGYMAPEQVRGSTPTDHRADIWAVCSVLYECVAGRPAIEGHGCNELLVATKDADVAPLKDGEELASLWSILQRGLRKNPADRFQSMDALRDDLVHWLTDHPGGEHRRRRRTSESLLEPGEAATT